MTKSGTTNLINRLAFIGNYLPRQCGIATFTTDLCEAIAAEYGGITCIAVPVNDTEAGYDYPPRVRFELTEKDLDSYRRAADFLNSNNLDLQHSEPEGGHFVPIGSNGFYQRGGERARFDQQPVEAQAAVSACLEAFRITGDKRWRTEARRAFQWFLQDFENIRDAWIKDQQVVVVKGKITEYRMTLKVSFVLKN